MAKKIDNNGEGNEPSRLRYNSSDSNRAYHDNEIHALEAVPRILMDWWVESELFYRGEAGSELDHANRTARIVHGLETLKKDKYDTWLKTEDPTKALAYWVSTRGLLHGDDKSKLAEGLKTLSGKRQVGLSDLQHVAENTEDFEKMLANQGYQKEVELGRLIKQCYEESQSNPEAHSGLISYMKIRSPDQPTRLLRRAVY